MNAIVNGAPMTVFQGTNDKSNRAEVAEAEVLPSHLPWVYLYTQDGPTTPQLVAGSSRNIMYGADSFDPRKAYATHATVLSNVFQAAGNAQIIQRLIPADAAPRANLRLALDVLSTKLPVYERNTDGSIKTDAAGKPVATSTTVDGYLVKWVKTHIALGSEGEDKFGQGTEVAGDQTDTDTGTQSRRIPILDLEVSHIGSKGNNLGVRLFAPTAKSSVPVSAKTISKEKVYPFRVAFVSRTDELSTAKVIETQSGEQTVNVTWQDIFDRSSEQELGITDNLLSKYQNLAPNDGSMPVFGPFGRISVYSENIAALQTLFYAAEKAFIDAFSDFTGASGEEGLFNFISGVSSNNVPYTSFRLTTGGSETVKPTEATTLWATGGSDGTMSNAAFDLLVRDAVADFANANNSVQDTAYFPTSCLYDSGFGLDVKKALPQFISLRKDTFVVLATHAVGESLTATEESSIAVALKTALQMYPESDYFGTETMRGVVVARSGKLLNSTFKKRLPLSIELANKAAKYMGAGNGIWNSVYSFDEYPANEVELFGDINCAWTPATARNKDWDNGMIWVENYGRNSVYFPAIRTVYGDDTSVLTSFLTMAAIVELEKVGDRARRRFSGNSKLTTAQLIERVNQFVEENTVGRFDERFTIVPETYITSGDEARGYSWTLKIKIYAANMKTVQTLVIEAYRADDLAAA